MPLQAKATVERVMRYLCSHYANSFCIWNGGPYGMAALLGTERQAAEAQAYYQAALEAYCAFETILGQSAVQGKLSPLLITYGTRMGWQGTSMIQ